MQNTADSFLRLVKIMDELREQCPWDKKQTIHTLRPLTLEETYELADAVTEEDWKGIKEELGDKEDDESGLDDLEKRLKAAELSEEAEKAAKRELKRVIEIPSVRCQLRQTSYSGRICLGHLLAFRQNPVIIDFRQKIATVQLNRAPQGVDLVFWRRRRLRGRQRKLKLRYIRSDHVVSEPHKSSIGFQHGFLRAAVGA